MKAQVFAVVILASVCGGLVGGALGKALETASPASTDVPVAGTSDTAVSPEELQLLRQELANQAREIAGLRNEIAAASMRDATLERANEGLTQQIKTLKEQEAAASDGEIAIGPAPSQSDLDNAVADALRKAREAEKARQEGIDQKKAQEVMQAARGRALKALDAKLNLSPYQRDRLDVILEDMNTQTIRLKERSAAADQAGTKFDWQTEWDSIVSTAEQSIRDELDSTQQTAFNAMLEGQGLGGILWAGK